MKIRLRRKSGKFDYTPTGKGKFGKRIIKSWKKLGHEVTISKNEPVDIDLCFNKHIYKPRYAKRNVMRCGPAHYDLNMYDLDGHNKDHRKYLSRCHGAIYQSAFAKKMWSKFVGYHPKHETVIFNGADPEFYAPLQPYESPYRWNFLASTRKWVWEKRLEDIVKSFILADVPDSCLWIAGDLHGKPNTIHKSLSKLPDKYREHKNIKFLYQCDEETVGRLYKMANAMIHCVYIDACPNSVCEALVAGCPVICTNVGGQVELVKPMSDNCIVECDEWNWKKRNRRKQPPVDMKELAEKINYYAIDKSPFDASYLHMDNIAKQYIDFFERVLND